MRIALLYHQFRSGAGGLERYLHGFATHLAEDGYELHLVGSEFDNAFSHLAGAKIHPVSCSGSKTARMRQFDQKSTRLAADFSPDVILGFGRTTAQDLHRAGGGCHRVYNRFLPAHKRLRRKNRLELELERELYTGGKTGRFVVNSALVGRQLETEYGVPLEKITVIHTPVDTARFAPAGDHATAKSAICQQLGTDPERPAFLFVSLNHRRKGLPALLEILSETDGDLWIAGAPLRHSHRALIKKRGITDRVHYLGKTNDLVPYYQAADAFLHPTLYDACANTVLQSMACALPGLISSRDGASEFVRDGENGYVLEDPTDHQQVLHGVSKLQTLGSEKRLLLADTARKTVLPLTWKTHLERWMEAIEMLQESDSASGEA